MTAVLSIVQLFVTLALIGVVLIQRSEGGGLGIGSSQGMGSFMGGRGTANLLTRITAVLATIFMVLSLVLALLNRGTVVGPSLLDGPVESAPATTTSAPVIPPPGSAAPAPAAAAPSAPQTPANPAPAPAPSVPTKD